MRKSTVWILELLLIIMAIAVIGTAHANKPVISFHPHYCVRIDVGYIPGAGKSLTTSNGNTITSESTDLFTSTVGFLF